MANAHSTLKNDKTKTPAEANKQRHYTIGPPPPNFRKPNPYPQLLIKGRWLEQLGFITGQAVIITTKKGQLIIELAR